MSGHQGGVPKLRHALARAHQLGCEVAVGNGGEVRVTPPPGFGPRLNINNRRKDSTIELTKLLDRLDRGSRGA